MSSPEQEAVEPRQQLSAEQEDLAASLEHGFPPPENFSRLRLWYRETTPSAALTILAATVLMVLVIWAIRVVTRQEITSPSVQIQQVNMSADDLDSAGLPADTANQSSQVVEQDSREEVIVRDVQFQKLDDIPDQSIEVDNPSGNQQGAQTRASAKAARASLKGVAEKIAKIKKPTPPGGGGTPQASGAAGGTPSEGDLQQRLKNAGAGTGDVTVSLAWNNGNDIDLHVQTPNGERIFFSNKTSSCGGILDFDRNAGGPVDLQPFENIFWPDGKARSGEYTVGVHHYRNWGFEDPTEFRIQVMIKGKIVHKETGRVVGRQFTVVHRFRFR